MATRKPATYPCPASRWSLDDLGAALQPYRRQPMSRASLWRLLEAADLKPPRSVYWLTRHAPAFEAKAPALCQLSGQALRFSHQGRVGICADAKTGRQRLPRRSPTQPVHPGKPEKREHDDIRHGGRALLASFVVPTGQFVWPLGQTRTSADGAAPWAHVVPQLPTMQCYAWVVDPLPTPGSLDVCRLVAPWCAVPCTPKALPRGAQRRAFLRDPTHTHGVHFPPKHGSWLNQGELWLSVLARRFLKRGDCCSAEDFATRLCDYLEIYNTPHAHPSRWPYTGQPLVRATPFSQTRCQQRQGRAWCSPRPTPFARACSPPRPYKRSLASLVANL